MVCSRLLGTGGRNRKCCVLFDSSSKPAVRRLYSMFLVLMTATILSTILLAVNPGGAAPMEQPHLPAPKRKTHRVAKKPRCRSLGRFKATVYGPPWGGIEGGSLSALGVKLRPGRHVIAVDPRVIPLRSLVRVWPNPLGYRGPFLAADTGGAIRGNHIDIFTWHGLRAKDQWGVRPVSVCFLGRRR